MLPAHHREAGRCNRGSVFAPLAARLPGYVGAMRSAHLTAILGGLLPCIASCLLGCGGGGPLERPSETAVQKSALGEQRCVTQGDEQRLFVVDWDATDLAGFESRAGR